MFSRPQNIMIMCTQLTGSICTWPDDDVNVVAIEFTEDFGDLPLLIPVSGPGVVVLVPTLAYDSHGKEFQSVKGTKESSPCSNKGMCSQESGACECEPGYVSSNGKGQPGNRGDCGFKTPGLHAQCAGGSKCSGHGVCDDVNFSNATFVCSCFEVTSPLCSTVFLTNVAEFTLHSCFLIRLSKQATLK